MVAVTPLMAKTTSLGTLDNGGLKNATDNTNGRLP